VDRLHGYIRAAASAPSSHNTQPWFFRITADAIDLFADRTRGLPVNDPHDRELLISCGCALFNLRAAIAADGIGVRIRYFADDAGQDWLARVHLADDGACPPEVADLARAIPHRHTYRRKFDEKPIDPDFMLRLLRAAEDEGAWFWEVEAEGHRHALADLVAEGDRRLWDDPRWRRELAQWMHPRRSGDGLAVPSIALHAAQAIVRTFDRGDGEAAKDRELAEHSPVLAILGTDSDTPMDWLRAGQALERVLLTAARAGIQASYLNQPLQVPELRSEVSRLAEGGFAQVVLRLGYPEGSVERTPRRELDSVFEESELKESTIGANSVPGFDTF